MNRVVGIDPSTQCLSAVVTGDGAVPMFVQHSLPANERTRDGKAFEWMQGLLQTMRAEGEGAVIYLEKPIAWRSGTSTIALGQISGALRAAAWNAAVPVIMVNNSTWKSRVLDSGRASKEQINTWLRLTHPELHAECVRHAVRKSNIQDLVDAACIYLYGAMNEARVEAIQKKSNVRVKRKG